jgi:hypothetical protein
MATYSKDKLRLISQGIVGGKIWYYTDTGIANTDGAVLNAGDMGCDSGDLVIFGPGASDHRVKAGGLSMIQDTGATQGSIGPVTLVGDTG